MTRPQNCGSGFCSCVECPYEPSTKANDTQVGGTHYRNKIQPWDYIIACDLDFFEGNALKYLTRWKQKDGVKDLKKCMHYLEKIIERAENGDYGDVKTD
jgi:hypothetical protein